ncbi:MAG: NADH-quinone oxidoreductase subunit NuoG [Actinomycetota bacterium]|nr:NADH-quinone oxidoreductase subunit NuoG [Actinomycetota bacterium]
MSNPETPAVVHITVDGVEVEAMPGEPIIEAAGRAGTFIPRFCYHPRMRAVGMCRMCLVEVSGPRGFSLQPSCYLPVTEGMQVITKSEKVKKAQVGVLEFLLVNHPLDCPVCDKGGECPLQDQTLAYGPGESRFVEEKRHWEKPIEISKLVLLDRERCIQCDRCVRFAREVAGDPFIDFAGRGDNSEVSTFPDGEFTSYFSGNTVQICPVGALTARPYRFKARPWDLEEAESTCTACSFGCRMAVQFSRGEVTRFLGIDSDVVNNSWLCDLGRFAYESLDSEKRLVEPKVRYRSEMAEVSWHDAMSRVGAHIRTFTADHGAGSIAFLGGAGFTNEGIHSFVKLAKTTIGTSLFDADLDGGVPASVVFATPRATLAEALAAKVLVVASADVREELPVLFLRLNDAVKKGLRIVEVSEVETSISALAAERLPLSAARLALALQSGGPDAERLGAAIAAAGEQGDGAVFLVGKSNIADPADVYAALAASASRRWPGAKFLFGNSRANIFGAMDLGAVPGWLPGRVATAPSDDAREIIARAADEPMLLFLLGADPLSEMPDTALVKSALENATVVLIDSFESGAAPYADVLLPLAAYGETAGTTTNFEGRVTRLGRAIVPKGQSKPDYLIAAEIGRELGRPSGPTAPEEIFAEMARELPLYRGLAYAELASNRYPDGLVVPLERKAISIGARPRRLDPIATPGLVAPYHQGPAKPFATEVGAAAAEPGAETPASPRSQLPEVSIDPAAVSVAADGRLRLLLTRRLYRPTAQLAAAPILSKLTAQAEIRVAPATLEAIGKSDGSEVKLRGDHGEEVAVVAKSDKSLPDGVVLGRLGDGANLLLLVKSGTWATHVKVGSN